MTGLERGRVWVAVLSACLSGIVGYHTPRRDEFRKGIDRTVSHGTAAAGIRRTPL